jgi:3-oxoacyl-[acyl-carrier-protein] synthase-1
MCKSAHIENIDEVANGMNILTEKKEGTFNVAMSNSFGFGGTNASLIFKRYN